MADVIADRLTHPVRAGHLAVPAGQAVDAPQRARIGVNTILQLIEVMREEQHDRWLRDIFYRSGLSTMLINPPTEMVEEQAVADLYQALFERLPPAAARRIAGKAGLYTARYMLANRIPGLAQVFLKILPAKWSARLLLRAIQQHARTFAGSGEVTIETSPTLALEIRANPIAMPGCVWHIQVFETLFQQLVSSGARVTQTACCRDGEPSCRFELALSGDGAW